MAPRQQDSLAELLEDLKDMPWWVSVILGVVAYLVMRFGVLLFAADSMVGVLARGISQVAWIAVIFAVPAAVSLWRSRRKRVQLDDQHSIESIRGLSWKQFEELLGEAYRRQGFSVIENPGKGADGGVDLTLRRGGETYLVQCKQWKTYKVGVKVVREMLGLVTAQRATGAIVVASGVFTNEARAFAANQPVELVDGGELVRLIGGVQANPHMAVPVQQDSRRVCPRCGRELVLRQARQGAHAGSPFWGCSGYPKCRHIEQAG